MAERRQLSEYVELVPAVELAPPNRPRAISALADAALLGVPILVTGSRLVAAGALLEPALVRAVVAAARETASFAERPELSRVTPLAGGYALADEGRVVLPPGCCGGLEDLAGWWRLLRAMAPPRRLWIGHPSVPVVRTPAMVLLRPGKGTVELAIDLPHLETAVRGAEVQVAELRGRLGVAARELVGPTIAPKIVDALAPVTHL